MKLSQKVFLRSLCIFLLSITYSTSAAPKNANNSQITDAQMQQAYEQLIEKPTRKKTELIISTKKKKGISRFHVVAAAKKQIRIKYRWGGSTPRVGFDCSGLTQYAFKLANITIPRTAAAQFKHSKRISLSKMQAGDLIFFHTRRTRARVNHVGIYLGNGKFIHAPRRGKRVSVAKLSKYWRRKVVGAGRV